MAKQLEVVELGRLASGATRFIQGNINEMWKGAVYIESGPIVAYVKIVSAPQLISELVCAVLGRYLGLNIPRPILVKIRKSDLPQSTAWSGELTECYGFGSEDVKHRNFWRYLSDENAHSGLLMNLLSKWDSRKESCFFDEWTANPDRNIKNLLYDGKDDFWLIDHAHALTGRDWEHEDLIPNTNVKNILLEKFSNALSIHEKYQWRKEAIAEVSKYRNIDIDVLLQNCHLEIFALTDQSDAVKRFLIERINHLPSLISAKLGVGELGGV